MKAESPPRPEGIFARKWLLWAALLLIGGLLRFAGLGANPPGLYQDEAINGLDAVAVLQGSRPLYFAANNGREPAYIYLATLSVGAFGRSAGAVRLPAAVLGFLTLPVVVRLGRAWFGPLAGWLAGGILAIMAWHIQLSRIGFRAVGLPLSFAAALLLGTRAIRTGRARDAVGAGLAYAAGWYIYLPARFTLLPIALFLLYALALHRDSVRAHLRTILITAVAAFIMLLPLGALALTDPGLVFGRGAQVGIWEESINKGDFAKTLLRSAAGALGMFNLRGDDIPRHNIPERPVFDPLIGIAFLIGLAALAQRFRRDPAAAATLIGLACMLLPTILAEDSPHFLRAVGVLPFAAFPAAVGLSALAARLQSGWQKRAFIAAMMGLSLIWSVRDYVGYGAQPGTAWAFQAAATDLAEEVRKWRGKSVVDARIWEEYEALPFLLGDRQDEIAIYPGDPLPGGDILIALWPYDEAARREILVSLPKGAAIHIEEGPLTSLDEHSDPFRAYFLWRVGAAEDDLTAKAQFADGIDLISAEVIRGEGDRADLYLIWHARERPTRDYTVFIHVEGGEAFDGPPMAGYLPSSWWRPGDDLTDIHAIKLPPGRNAVDFAAIRFGLYDWVSGERLEVLKSTVPGNSEAGDEIVISVPVGSDEG